jgi:hypothetical protein
MKYAVEMGSGAMMYEVHTKFYKYWFSHSKLDGGGVFADRQNIG